MIPAEPGHRGIFVRWRIPFLVRHDDQHVGSRRRHCQAPYASGLVTCRSRGATALEMGAWPGEVERSGLGKRKDIEIRGVTDQGVIGPLLSTSPGPAPIS